jgi:hypothetical protein
MQQESFGRAVNGGKSSTSGPGERSLAAISRSFRWSGPRSSDASVRRAGPPGALSIRLNAARRLLIGAVRI